MDAIEVSDPVIWNDCAYVVREKEWRKLDPANPWVLLEPIERDLRAKWVPAFECRALRG